MPFRAMIVMPPRKSVETVAGDSMILLCQDAADAFIVMCGKRGDLHTLMLWGAKNWFALPPDETYFRALDEIIEPLLEPNDRTETRIVSATCARHFAEGSAMPGGNRPMSFALHFDGRALAFDGITDALFFMTDERGEIQHANGGSGMQKGRLLEIGIGELFGMDAMTRFCDAKYAGMPAGIRQFAERIRAQMRKIRTKI